MNISKIHENVVLETQSLIGIIVTGDPISELGSVFEELAAHFQALAICHLLKSVDLAEFQNNLIRSGQSRRYFLKKSRELNNDRDRHLGISRTDAFFDSIAAGELGLAHDIATLSTENWQPDWEYEDDFCYFLYLHHLLLHPDQSSEDGNAILDRFEVALEGDLSSRLSVCRALQTRDSEAFHEELLQFMEELRTHQNERKMAVEDGQYLYWPRSYISTEGLALLRLAERLGMETSGEYLLCPDSTRRLPVQHDVPDYFDEVDTAIQTIRSQT